MSSNHRVVSGGSSVSGSVGNQSHHAKPQTQAPKAESKKAPTEARKTKIQVCARIRPILPHDREQQAKFLSSLKLKQKQPQLRSSQNKSSGASVGGGSVNGGSVSGGNNRRKAGSNRARRSSITSTTTNDAEGGDGGGSGDGCETLDPAWNVHPDHHSISQNSAINPELTRTNTYKFDHCFDPTQTTLDLYSKTVKDSVRAFMEGYHTSIFAYGQTATGKTFTMTGDNTNKGANSRGIIQLAIRDCFDYIHDEKAEGREYLLRVSFMEIYNEVVNDLLIAPTNTNNNNSFTSSSSNGRDTPVPVSSASNIRIFESKREGVVIRGLKEEIVTSYSEVLTLLAAGERRRQTGSTQQNKQSSRSHSIFRLTVESRQRLTATTPDRKPMLDRSVGSEDSIASGKFKGNSSGPVRVSTLSMVDLAGSESVKNTGSKGARQKEGQYINKSLLTLGHVVWKLAELSSKKTDGDGNNLDTTHIPYRDSKLTRLLQPSLSGRAQIVLICNISPIAKHLEESHSTLKFATRAKRIKQNVIITEVVNEKTLLQNYREEIDDLKRQLRDAKETTSEEKSSGGAGAGRTIKGRSYSSRSSGSSEPDDEEEMGIIVQAIHNLERLILTTTTAQERKKKKKRKTNKYREDNIFDLDHVKNPSDNSHMSRMQINTIESTRSIHSDSSDGDEDDEDGLLEILDVKPLSLMEEDLLDMSLVSKTTPRSSSLNTKDDFSLTTDMSTGDDTIIEGKKLISELQRVQGLLGSVLMRKTPTKIENGVVVRNDKDTNNSSFRGIPSAASSPLVHTHQSSLLILKNEEVERLRGQLHQQAMATSLRQADSSFLQSQLQEKDTLLHEVSKILESVERRQIQLEKENVGWKEDWAKSVANLRAKEGECEKTVSLLKARESEIQQLRRQLERSNG